MKEIIASIQNWNQVRNNADALKQLFNNKVGFNLDFSLFIQKNSPLHAYAAVNNNVLGFYIIAEVDDVISDTETLEANIYWCPCVEVLQDDQHITEGEALLRINDWRNTKNSWIDAKLVTDGEMYQNFYIPTTDLHDANYTVYFGLKNNTLGTPLKVADLVLKNNANVYFDTIKNEPPYKDRPKYLILDLL